MTQEEKAKAYDEAVKRAKAAIDIAADKDLVEGVVKTILPELRESESEDERVRKALIDLVCTVGEYYLPKLEARNKMLDYLEKQEEQKPVEYLPKRKVYDIMNKLTELSTSDLIPIESEEYVKIHEITSDVCSLLDYPIEQKPDWSEEDESCWNLIWDILDGSLSLRPQPKQERQIKKGDKVSIHCRKDREEYIIDIYDGKVGEVIDVWDKKYPWGHIAVKLDNGCNNSFHEDELEVLDEPYCKTWEEVKSENNVDINYFEKEKGQYEYAPNQTFTIEEIENFVHDHIQQKIDNDELHLTGIGNDNFEREFMIYRNALFEGIVNGISMCNNKVEGIEDK